MGTKRQLLGPQPTSRRSYILALNSKPQTVQEVVAAGKSQEKIKTTKGKFFAIKEEKVENLKNAEIKKEIRERKKERKRKIKSF